MTGLAIALLLSGLVAAVVTALLARGAAHRWLMDHPNERSLHERPTPRGGGLGVLAGLLAGGGVLVASGTSGLPGTTSLVVGALLLAGVSLLDDVRPLPAAVRMAVHLVAAGGLVLDGVVPGFVTLPGIAVALPAALAAVLGVLFTVWMLNLYNFMDGMDGFAGGMTVSGFGAMALLAATAGAWTFMAVCLLVAAAAAGFLVFNFPAPKARIFMGDVGSVPIGFLAAGLILLAERDGIFAWWLGVLVFSPFVVDATVTLARRLLAGERVWQAHRSHYYQRLVQHGWGHRRTVLWEYALMAACALSALAVQVVDAAPFSLVVGLGWAVGYTALAVGLARRWHGSSGVSSR